MQDVLLDYGDTHMRVGLPDSAVVVRYGQTYADPPPVNPHQATRRALEHPHGFPTAKGFSRAGQKGRDRFSRPGERRRTRRRSIARLPFRSS